MPVYKHVIYFKNCRFDPAEDVAVIHQPGENRISVCRRSSLVGEVAVGIVGNIPGRVGTMDGRDVAYREVFTAVPGVPT